MRLKDKVAVVTGGARGIGRAMAEAFAKEGAKIVVADVIDDVVKSTAAEIKNVYSVDTLALKVDVTNSGDCENMVAQTVEKFSGIDILINNAGITKDNLLLRMSDSEWDMVLNINLKGAFLCSRAAIKYMMKQRSGRIINICSIVGLMGNAGQCNYAASKGGLIALTKSMARELASRSVLVNAIAPGFIKSPMTDKLSDEQKKSLANLIPLGRLGEPNDVASCALFLASDESSYITGQVLSVNGGMYM